MNTGLLSTKLFIPDLRFNAVNRISLRAKLDCGIELGCGLTLVSAPAGYGKTTLIADWLNNSQYDISWLSLDDADNDYSRFFLYFLEACKKYGPGVGDDVKNLLTAPGRISEETLISLLVNDLGSRAKPCIVVLDDYHLIKSKFIHQAMHLFLEKKPGSMHIVLITREEPPFNLSRMRVLGRINEIRMEDLRFNNAETTEFLLNTMHLNMKEEIIKSISNRTEGWIAGIQLAALSLRGIEEDEIEEFVHKFSGKHHYIIDYLVEEVLKRQSEIIREFLYKTSFLERMNASLCNAVTGRSDSKSILLEMLAENLFLVPLDKERQWYRYHHLFADSLKVDLDEEVAKETYSSAFQWFEQNNLLQEATQYALKAQNLDEAVRIMEIVQADLIHDTQITTLMEWLDALPEDMVRRSQVLNVRKGWAYLISGNMNRAASHIATFDEAYQEKLNALNRGLFISLKASLAAYRGAKDVESLAREALELIGKTGPLSKVSTLNTLERGYSRVATLNTLSREYLRVGNMHKALEVTLESFELGDPMGFSFVTIMAAGHMALILNAMGRRRESLDFLQSYLKRMISVYGKPLSASGYIFATMALAQYDSNDLETANENALQAMAYCSKASVGWSLNVHNTLAAIQYAMGDMKSARSTLKDARIISDPVNLPLNSFQNEALESEIAIRQGNIREVESWVERNKISVMDLPSYHQEQAYFTFVRLLFLKDMFSEAGALLERMSQSAETFARQKSLISILILRAVHARLIFDERTAVRYLEKAVMLSADEDYYQPFLGEGGTVFDLLPRLNAKAPDFIGQIIEKHRGSSADDGYERVIQKKIGLRKKVLDFGSGLLQPISGRELEILKQLDEGLSNFQIAEKLFVSLHTIQWHLSNLYSKLGVKSRTQAIKKAKEIGIL